MKEYPQQEEPPVKEALPQEELPQVEGDFLRVFEQRRNVLNALFKAGKNIYDPEVRRVLELTSFPIVVDFNGVLVNNKPYQRGPEDMESQLPLKINPDAEAFLAGLEKLGEVFVVTTAKDRDAVGEMLRAINKSDERVVWLSPENYVPKDQFTEIQDPTSNMAKTVDGYLKMIDDLEEEFGQGWSEKFDLSQSKPEERRLKFALATPVNKSLAPAFKKPWRIPVIDDSGVPGKSIGMLGIHVKTWPCEEDPLADQDPKEETRIDLKEAIEALKTHKRRIVQDQTYF
jgi:hypothetical protein